MARSRKGKKKKTAAGGVSSRPPQPARTQPEGPSSYALALVLGLALAVQPLVLHLFVTDEYETPKLIFLRGAALLVLATWFFTALRRGLPRHLARSLIPLGAYLGIFILSAVASASPRTSLLGEYGSLAGVQSQLFYLLMCAAAASLASAGELRLLLLCVLAGAVPSTGMALVEASGHEIGTFFGMTAEIPAHTTSGTFGNANYFAGYTVSIIPVALLLLRDRSKAVRLLAAALALASAVAVFISGSRAGFLCLALTALWLPLFIWHPYLLQRRRDRAVTAADDSQSAPGSAGLSPLLRKQALLIGAAALVVIAVGAYIALPQVKRVGDSLMKPAQALSADRTHLWGPALAMAADHPLLGAGPDTYATAAQRYFTPYVYKRLGSTVTARRAHSEPLNMLACVGVLGLLAWLWLFGGALWRALRRALDRGEAALDPLSGLALGTALALGLGFNLLHFVTVGQAPWLFVLAGLLIGAGAHARGEEERFTLPRPAALVGVGLSLALFLLASWDGDRWLDADKQLKLAVVASLRKRTDQALSTAGEAARLRPFERRYREAAAQHLLRAAAGPPASADRAAQLERARQEIEAALRINRAPLALWIALAVEQKAGQVEAAAALATEAMDRDPTRPSMLRKNVDWFMNRGQLDTVRALFDPAFRQDPEGAAALAVELARLILPKLPTQTQQREPYLELIGALLERAREVESTRERAQALMEQLTTSP